MTKKDEAKVKKTTNKMHWYAVNTYSGSENKVKETLLTRVQKEQLEDQIVEIIVANYKELSTKIKKSGEQVQVEKIKNNFPGYIFIKMYMSDYAWFIVRNTQGVTGFVGSTGKKAKPFPMTDEEVENIKKLQDRIDDSLLKFEWSIGEKVEVKKGSFKGEIGIIKNFNLENKTATINLEMFGKKTPTEIDLTDIKRLK